MAGERAFWKYLLNGMGRRWSAQRHEDRYSIGVPDVSYGIKLYYPPPKAPKKVNGWIELKVIESWPKRPGTIVKVPHYEIEQKIWLRERGETGGSCFFFLKVLDTKEYLLFTHITAQSVGRLTREELENSAIKRWINRINWDSFLEVITSEA